MTDCGHATRDSATLDICPVSRTLADGPQGCHLGQSHTDWTFVECLGHKQTDHRDITSDKATLGLLEA